MSVARIELLGIAPMTQSHQHTEPFLRGESHDDYDIRTWPSKLNVEERDGKKTVVIPAHGIHQAIVAGAKYSKRQIPNQARALWWKKFEPGIMVMDSAALNIDPQSVTNIVISANADGVRGSGKRVPRRFPYIPRGWRATFDVMILDPIITRNIFHEMLTLTGMFIGLGQFRPEKGGHNGRFKVVDLSWEDNRPFVESSIHYMNNREFQSDNG
jgi:hypothetical protein